MSDLRFADIPQFTRATYTRESGWGFVEKLVEEYAIDFSPDYQREHVWTPEQQSAYIEFCLRGGESGRDLYFNYATENNPHNERIEIVDGKQRLTSVREFMAGRLRAFGLTIGGFEDRLPAMEQRFRLHINDLQTRAEVLQWYLDLNYAGTPHTDDELRRVQALLAEAKGRSDDGKDLRR